MRLYSTPVIGSRVLYSIYSKNKTKRNMILCYEHIYLFPIRSINIRGALTLAAQSQLLTHPVRVHKPRPQRITH